MMVVSKEFLSSTVKSKVYAFLYMTFTLILTSIAHAGPTGGISQTMKVCKIKDVLMERRGFESFTVVSESTKIMNLTKKYEDIDGDHGHFSRTTDVEFSLVDKELASKIPRETEVLPSRQVLIRAFNKGEAKGGCEFFNNIMRGLNEKRDTFYAKWHYVIERKRIEGSAHSTTLKNTCAVKRHLSFSSPMKDVRYSASVNDRELNGYKDETTLNVYQNYFIDLLLQIDSGSQPIGNNFVDSFFGIDKKANVLIIKTVAVATQDRWSKDIEYPAIIVCANGENRGLLFILEPITSASVMSDT